MRVRQQSTATYAIPIYMILSSDHVSAATGKTVSVTLSKNGGAFAAASGAVSELSSGVYSLAGNATDTNTLGSLVVLATATGCDPYLVEYTIVPFNPFDSVRMGLTALPNAAAEAAGGLFTRGTGAGQINQAANGQIDANAARLGGTTQTGRDIGASVLISSGTGTGQLDVTSGVIKANLAQILGTALTETAGQIAAAFKQFFDVASPTGTMKAITSVGSVSGAVGSVTGNVGGNVVGSVASVTAGVTVTTNNDKTGYSLSTTPLASADLIAASGTASAGASTSITLTGASATDDLYKNATVAIVSGTGAGQVRTITAYNGTTKVATVSPAWATNPDATSVFRVYYAGPGVVDVNNDKTGYTASTVSDKTGYALTAGEHTNIASDTQTGLTAQGYTTTRAGYLDTLNGLVQAIWDKATSALTTAGSIGKLLVDNINATIGSRMATFSLPTNFSSLSIDGSGRVDVSKIEGTDATDQIAGAVLNATASSYNTASTIGEKINSASAPSAATVADAVWDEAIAGHLTGGSAGASLNAAGSAGDPWTTTLPGAYSSGQAGYIVGTNINATVSSRSTLDGTGVQSALTSQGYTTTRAGYLDTLNGLVQAIWDKATSAITTAGSIGKQIKDNLDAAISSRMATFTYTTPPTVTEIRQEMDANSTKLANLDATVSSRLATAGYTAPLGSTATAQAVLNATAASYNTAGSIGAAINSASAPSAATVADAVWDEAISGHLTAGSTGAKLNSAAAAGDPWSTALPGSYASGEAGNILAAINSKTAGISTGTITVTSPVVDADTVNIVRGDDYKNADGRALFATTTFSNAPSLIGGQVALRVKDGTTPFSKAGAITGAAACYVELTTSETAAFQPGNYAFDLQATLSNGDIVTIAQGNFNVLADVR